MLRAFVSRRALVASAIGALLLSACANAPSLNAPREARAALAPTGVLRIAVYPGSPTSLVQEAAPEDMRGVSVDLGHALAARLDVPAKVQVYPLLAPALAAVQRGEADFTVTNATAERAKLVDFGPPLLDLELGVLVPAGSRVSSVDAIDRPGVTVGVSRGSSSERVLGGRYSNARLRSFPTLDAARAALVAREIDAYATNKGILYELSDRVPGSRVLEGRWGAEHLAAAVPKGREAGLAFLRTFSEEVRTSGELDRAAKRAGLRGTAPPEH
jgi:polar amino acid transport system substrate-binding protein